MSCLVKYLLCCYYNPISKIEDLTDRLVTLETEVKNLTNQVENLTKDFKDANERNIDNTFVLEQRLNNES